MSKGMEIFNSDDSLDDFLEIDENLLLNDGLSVSDIVNPQDANNGVKPPKNDQKKDDDNIDDDEDEKDDSDELDLLLPSEKGDNDKDIQTDSSTLSPKFFSSLVQALKEGGILEDVNDNEIKSQEDFFNVIEESVKAREFSDLTDTQKEYLEALRSGIPHEEISEYQRNIDAYNSITDDAIEEETEDGSDLRRTIIMNNFVSKGINEAKAKKLTDKIFDSGEDVDEAKEALGELKNAEKAQFEADKQARINQKKLQEKAEKDAQDKLNKIVKETTEIIPGMKIPNPLKQTIIKGLTQPVAYTEDKRPLDIISKYLHDNPIDGRFKLAYLLTITDGMKKMNVLENKKAKANAFKELENALRYKEEGGTVGFGETESKNFNLDDYTFV